MKIVTSILLQCSGSKTHISFNEIICVIKIISTYSFQEIPNRYLMGKKKLKVQTRSSPEGPPYLLGKKSDAILACLCFVFYFLALWFLLLLLVEKKSLSLLQMHDTVFQRTNQH